MKKNKWYLITFILSLSLIIVFTMSCITVYDQKTEDKQTTTPSTVKRSPPVINSFTADPANITPGKQAYLKWNVSGATEVNIHPVVGDVYAVSTVLVSPETTTTYTLTAANDAGNVTADVTVTVATAAISDKPDLVITDIWLQVQTVYYKIKNIGGEPASGSRTHMYINDKKTVETDDYAEALAPGEERTESFGRYTWRFRVEPIPIDLWSQEILPTQYIIKVCADDQHSVIEANDNNNCTSILQGQKVVYRLVEAAHVAKWTTNAGKLDWPLPEGNKTGAAFVKESMIMEDGKGHAKVLATYPDQVQNGWIQGVFSGFYTEPNSLALMYRPVEVPMMAKFTAEVGFKRDATDTDGVWFKFGVVDESGVVTFFPGIFAKYDEKLDFYEVDLSELAGKKVSYILRVEDGEGNLYQQNNAIWINPMVTQ